MPAAISLMRDMDEPSFEQEHAELLKRMLAHLARGLGLMFHLRDSHWRLAASVAALNELTTGLVMLDEKRRVVFTNKAAEVVLSREDSLCLRSAHAARPGQLRLQDRLLSYENRLQHAIDLALEPLTNDTEYVFSEGLIVPDDKGQAACVIHVAPLPYDHHMMPGEAGAIVFVYDLRRAASVSVGKLVDLFGMTPAEGKAAIQLMQGGGIEEMATRSGVSINTFKSQLRAAYTKSGAHRQADLLKLLLALGSR